VAEEAGPDHVGAVHAGGGDQTLVDPQGRAAVAGPLGVGQLDDLGLERDSVDHGGLLRSRGGAGRQGGGGSGERGGEQSGGDDGGADEPVQGDSLTIGGFSDTDRAGPYPAEVVNRHATTGHRTATSPSVQRAAQPVQEQPGGLRIVVVEQQNLGHAAHPDRKGGPAQAGPPSASGVSTG
jgi:hypothetical protein